MLGMRLQVVAFFAIGNVVGAIEQRAPKARRRLRLPFDGLEPAADLVVQRHRAVQFGDFRSAQREFQANFSRRQHLADVAENEPRQCRPQREQDRVDESSRQLPAAFRHDHARDSTERYATNADSRGRITSPLPEKLGAEPDRMLAADGQNTGEPGRSKADDFSARAGTPAGRHRSASPEAPAADWPESLNRPRARHHGTAAGRMFAECAAPTRSRPGPAAWRPFPWFCRPSRESCPLRDASDCGWNSATIPDNAAARS